MLLIIILSGLLASILTSFIGAVIDRTQEGGSILNPPRSQCVCGEDLKAYQLIPIFYPIFARFTAPCGSRIPYRYPFGELFAAIVAGIGTYMLLNGGVLFGAVLIFFSLFTPAMVFLSHHQKLKKETNLND